jgi:hypothetical protein
MAGDRRGSLKRHHLIPFAAGLKVGWSQDVVPFRGTSGHSGLDSRARKEPPLVGPPIAPVVTGIGVSPKPPTSPQPNAIVMSPDC